MNFMLSMKQVSKTYSDGTHALKGISLELPYGMIGLLGPNGAGKSTLMRTLACLQYADKGMIIFDGIDLKSDPDKLRNCLGYLPQYFGVYPNMSCFALLEHMAILKGLSKEARKKQIPELLKLTNLYDVSHKRVDKFSGGMKQRFGIAQALLGNPKIIIMDEPTSGLDPVERAKFQNLLVEISKEKLILLSTHIVEDIENLCNHVAILMDGEIVDSNDVKSLIEPLAGHIWQTYEEPKQSKYVIILNKTYRYGLPVFRLYSKTKPCPQASPLTPTLQDRYFYELQLREI